MRIHISKKDVIWSYIGYFFTLFTNILILPFVMKFVPTTQLGLWYTFLSVGQIVTIFDGTFNGSISRNVTYAWSGVSDIKAEGIEDLETLQQKTNYRLLVSILVTCKRIFAVVAIIALVFFVTAGTAYIGYAAAALDTTVWVTAWIIYVIGVFMNLYYGYWPTVLRGVGAIQQAQKASLISKIVQIGVSIAGLFCGGGIISLSLAYLLSGIALRTIGKFYLYRYDNIGENYNSYSADIPRNEVRSNFQKIWYNSKKNGLVCIGSFLITQSTTLICSAFLGLEETASYGLSLQIITALAGVALIYFNTMRSKLTELKISGEEKRDEFISTLSLVVTIYCSVYIFGMAALLTVGLPVLSLLKSDTVLPIAMVAFMGLYLFLENNHSLFAGIIEMSNIVPYVKPSLISAVCIVVLDVVVAKFTSLGIYGLMFVQFAVQLCYSNWKWPMVVMNEYNLSPFSIIKRGLIEMIHIVKRVKSK